MLRMIKQAGCAIFLGAILPTLVIGASLMLRPIAAHPVLLGAAEMDIVPMIAVLTDRGLTQMPREAYIAGVLLAELPADFETQTKMAQAVVARTYALRTARKDGKHSGSVCTDSACCQGYIGFDAYLESGGSEEAVESARQAAQETRGQVLTYEGDLIEATYFSCSGGYTEDAAAVWGADVPYLQAVQSPGEEQASHYTDTVQLSLADFAAALNLTKQKAAQLGPVSYTEGGGVASMRIGGKEFTGTQLRGLLSLRSTAMQITVVGDTVTITTRGFGHRVGMSQYGADAMAVLGSSYAEILSHYYPGTVIETTDK